MRTIKKNIMNTSRICMVVLSVVFLCVFFAGCDADNNTKQPSKYTWEEFEALSDEEQMAFQNSFDSIDDFDAWLQEAQSKGKKYPWNKEGAKQPSEYTWEEFEALSGEEQMVFQNSFESIDAFDAWWQEAQSKGKKYPWNKEGAKQPSKYTWEEFEALNDEEQMAFQNSFDSIDDFDAWLQEAQPNRKEYPWNKEGAKQPSEYTWEEFEALSGEEQIVFQNSFESFDDFDKWLIANQPN